MQGTRIQSTCGRFSTSKAVFHDGRNVSKGRPPRAPASRARSIHIPTHPPTRPGSRQRSCIACNINCRSISGRIAGSETPADRVPFRPSTHTPQPSQWQCPFRGELDLCASKTSPAALSNFSAWHPPLTMPFAVLVLQVIGSDHTELEYCGLRLGNAYWPIGLFRLC